MKKGTKTIRTVYQLKVTLRNVHPPVWRRVQVWEDATLGELHRVLQIVMGWEDGHLHQFKIGERDYSIPSPDDEFLGRPVIDETRVRLQNVVPRVGTQFEYWYDFGDDWLHDLLLEAILLPDRAHLTRAASPASAVGRRKMLADPGATSNTSKCWPIRSTKSMRKSWTGAAHLTRSRFQ